MFQIISDGSCDLSADEAREYNVDIVPFYVTFDETNYLKEEIDITKEDYFTRLKNDKELYPKTSQPSPQDYLDIYKKYLDKGEDILVVTISSKLSGSNNSARIASEMASDDYPDRTIKVVDSLTATIGQGLIVREIIKMRDAGYTLDKTVETASKIIPTSRLYFTLDSLEYLKRGGRISSAKALVGGMLGIKPILHIVDGEVVQLDKVRGNAKAIKFIEDKAVGELSSIKGDVNISIGHILSKTDAADLLASVESLLGVKIENPITDVGVTIGTHVGPGALPIAYCMRYDRV